MNILDFCETNDGAKTNIKPLKLTRTQRRTLIRKLTLRNVKPNPQGGWLVKTIMSNDEFEIFRKNFRRSNS